MSVPKNLILTGTPGVGKTTLLKECVYPFLEHVGGFFTEAQIEGTHRQGFLLKTWSGQTGLLASKGLKSRIRLDKYGIDLKVLDEIGVPAIRDALKMKAVVVVDEIGSMEMKSEAFCQVIAQVLMGPKPVLATIRMKAEPFTSEIKKMSDTQLITLNKTNHVELKDSIRTWLDIVTRN